MKKSAFLAVTSILLFALVTFGQEQGSDVEKVFAKIASAGTTNFWDNVSELSNLGKEAIPVAHSKLQSNNPYVKISASKFLYDNGENKADALDALLQVVNSNDINAKELSANLISTLIQSDRTIDEKKKTELAKNIEGQAFVADTDLNKAILWRAATNISQSTNAIHNLKKIVESDNKKAQQVSALGLAELGLFDKAKNVLKELANEPTENGKLARTYLKLKDLQDDLARSSSKPSTKTNNDYSVIDEIISLLKSQYYDPEKVKEHDLLDAAARGLSSSIDPYTAYYDEKMLTQLFDEELKGEYGGVGARVSMRKDKNGIQWLTIEEPIFSGPAYKAGLRALDKIVEIEGETTANKEINDLVKKLRGKVGTSVKFKVYRRGWLKERPYELNREKVIMETTISRILPGNIGYIKTITFGDKNTQEVEQALKEFKAKDIKALIFDLRGNPGGYLTVAEKITEEFLSKGKNIVSTKGRNEILDTNVSNNDNPITCPMVVLIDGGSASASEIMAGALQDNKRAKLIGEKSFGKGSVQNIIKLESTNEKSALRLTIAKWLLPSGHTIEKDKQEDSGVEPDIKVVRPEPDLWKDAEFDKLRLDGKIEDYFKDNFTQNEELFTKLAENDDLDYAKYPKFDELHKSLNTKLEKMDVREMVREYARKWVADKRGRALELDYETDVQLQAAISEMLKEINTDIKTIAEYKTFANKQNF